LSSPSVIARKLVIGLPEGTLAASHDASVRTVVFEPSAYSMNSTATSPAGEGPPPPESAAKFVARKSNTVVGEDEERSAVTRCAYPQPGRARIEFGSTGGVATSSLSMYS